MLYGNGIVFDAAILPSACHEIGDRYVSITRYHLMREGATAPDRPTNIKAQKQTGVEERVNRLDEWVKR